MPPTALTLLQFLFTGPSETNRPEHPEWVFLQARRWLDDHAVLLAECVFGEGVFFFFLVASTDPNSY